MKTSILLQHVQSAEKIRNPKMLALLAAAGLRVSVATLTAWRKDRLALSDDDAAVIRAVCGGMHTCARCEGNPSELRELSPRRPVNQPTFNLGVGCKAGRKIYARRLGTVRRLVNGLDKRGFAFSQTTDLDGVPYIIATIKEIRPNAIVGATSNGDGRTTIAARL